MCRLLSPVLCLVLLAPVERVLADDVTGHGPLHILPDEKRIELLPAGTLFLMATPEVERFLDALDGEPPDWPTVYGHGHHDPGHDDRLFALNRERDAKRTGNPALSQLLTFAWIGELSRFDPVLGGYSVSLGPKFISTRWGIVRFKPEEAPGNLLVIPDPTATDYLSAALQQTGTVEIEVLMTGRLIPDESLVYDFSHAEEGQGLIMPVVRVERVDFLHHPPRQ